MAPSAIPMDGSNVDTPDVATAGRLLSRINLPPTPNPEPADSQHDVKGKGHGADSAMIREHLGWVIEHDGELQRYLSSPGEKDSRSDVINLSGDDLTIAELVAASWYEVPVRISKESKVLDRVNASVDFLSKHLQEGNVVYGINTGYGGSADTRSNDFISMQRGLIQHQNSIVLLPSDKGKTTQHASNNLDGLKAHNLPRNVVRGAMVARCNSLLRGHSAVRLTVIEAITTLLNRDFIPIIPLRGSISASGDLAPLSYIAGALAGNSDIYLDCRVSDDKREILSADEAVRRAGLEPIVMMPKEGLGLMNGTGVSCAAAAVALHETQYLALAAQVLTAMCTEAMRGSADNFHPFISDARPHQGQREVAENISRQLKASKLVVGKDAKTAGLYQDRYALRTAPQWIGPQLEDLSLAARQIGVELNSTTDNPLVDIEQGHVHHGGNFQAASVTSAMEKSRLALQMLGKLMFAQCTEMINPALNHILTPNLCFDDPGVSFTFKGVDINMAAYQSELAFLANPVSSHVQSAEMHNQAVNSLALISARYTMDAVELVSLMTSAYLYALCQALDLHVLYLEYMTKIQTEAQQLFAKAFSTSLSEEALKAAWEEVNTAIRVGLANAKSKDTPERARSAAEATLIPITKSLARTRSSSTESPFSKIDSFTSELTSLIISAIRSTRIRFASADGPPTLQYLGHGSAVMYRYVRHELGLPLHKGLVVDPTYPELEREGVRVTKEEKVTIGSRIGVIYAALRSGDMGQVFIKALS